MDIITNLAFIAQQATDHQDDYEAFRYYVEDDDLSDEELDRLVKRIAEPIIAGIDCTTCANCCRNLDVYLTPSDAQRLSKGLLISLSQIQDDYIDYHRAEPEGEWGMLRAKPCRFLVGTQCSIYDHRPESCRAYPEFTPDFRWQLGHILAGVGLCPIIYNVIERMKQELNW
jgi:hypothetical protein